MDERLVSMYRRFTWRILSNYVTPWEFEQLKNEITDYEQWCAAWSRHAARHVERGDAALAAGRRLTAGDAYLRGALAYHWASFVFTHDQAQFRAALEAMGDAWARAAPLVAPPMEPLAVPFEGLVMPGYLRVPDQASRPPVVLLLPGADSAKEELYNLADHIVARGLAVAAFDGPGQGLLSFDSKLRPDQEVAIQAIVSALAARPDLDGARLAVGGISYGGMFAVRTAAVDERVRAVFAISTWYTAGGRRADRGRIRRAGDHGDLPGRGPHPQQPLVPGAAAGGRLARRDPLTAGERHGLHEGRGQAGGQGAVHWPVGGHHRPVQQHRRDRRGRAARRPGPAHRRPCDRRDLRRRGDERV